MEGLPVSYSLNSGDNGNNWWGDFIGAAIGGIATEIANLGSQLSQGQCRTEAAVLTTGLNGQIQQKDNTIAQLNAAHAVEM